MRVTDSVTGQQFGVDEAYERFFDGFYNLGKPASGFERTMVLGAPRHETVSPARRTRSRRVIKGGRRSERRTN
jgi:hypothetical protein